MRMGRGPPVIPHLSENPQPSTALLEVPTLRPGSGQAFSRKERARNGAPGLVDCILGDAVVRSRPGIVSVGSSDEDGPVASRLSHSSQGGLEWGTRPAGSETKSSSIPRSAALAQRHQEGRNDNCSAGAAPVRWEWCHFPEGPPSRTNRGKGGATVRGLRGCGTARNDKRFLLSEKEEAHSCKREASLAPDTELIRRRSFATPGKRLRSG